MTSKIPQYTKNRVVSMQWKDQNGDVKPLTGASSVKGVLRSGVEPNPTDAAIVGAIAITNAALGLTEWTLHSSDTAESGVKHAVFYAYFSGDQILISMQHTINFTSSPTPPA